MLGRQTLTQKTSLALECKERAGKATTGVWQSQYIKRAPPCAFPTQGLVPLPPSGTHTESHTESLRMSPMEKPLKSSRLFVRTKKLRPWELAPTLFPIPPHPGSRPRSARARQGAPFPVGCPGPRPPAPGRSPKERLLKSFSFRVNSPPPSSRAVSKVNIT